MKLIPQKGFGQVLLGMTEADVLEILGEPDSKEVEDQNAKSGDTHSWGYDKLGVELAFDQDADYRLTRIVVFNPNATILGEKPIGISESEISSAFPRARLDYTACGMKDYVDPEIDVSLWVDDGKIVNITLYPKYDETGNNPQWPSAR